MTDCKRCETVFRYGLGICVVLIVLSMLMGCSNLPAPDQQIRLSELHGSVEGRIIGGAQGTACVLTIVGELPVVEMSFQQGPCRVVISSQIFTE